MRRIETIDLIILMTAIFLIPFTTLKLGRVKIMELYTMLTAFYFAITWLLRLRRLSIPSVKPDFFPLFHLGLILAMALVTVISFFQQKFYIPSTIHGFLERPVWISISRLSQYLMIWIMIVFCLQTVDTLKKLKTLIYVYLLTAGLICLYGLICWVILHLNHSLAPHPLLGSVYFIGENLIRIRGSFVEGGPFGLYLASVIVLGFFSVFTEKQWSKRLIILYLALGVIILPTYILTYSGAGFLALILIAGAALVLMHYQKKTLLLITGSVILAILVAVTFPILKNRFYNYIGGYQNAREYARLQIGAKQDQNPNFFYGRIAGMIIVPKIIEKNPLTGVGLGNYPIVRNNPEYRQFMSEVIEWDLSAMGWLDLCAEVGLILGPALLGLFLFFIFYASRYRSLAVLPLLFQPVAHLTGLQFTFFYVWFITAFGLCYLALEMRQKASEGSQEGNR